VTLDKDFAGVPAGARLLISCPIELEAWLSAHVPGDDGIARQRAAEKAPADGDR
jgi:hypothetical protein